MQTKAAAAVLLFSLAGAPLTAESRVERNVVYGMYSGLALLMDIHHPENPNGFGLIHISGSGWGAPLSLDARPLKQAGHVQREGLPLVEAGYTLFTVNHRATPRFRYPAAVEDVQRAVRFIRFHAERYGINPGKIGAIGGSSGGHLVSMLGVLDGRGDPDDESEINRLSAKVQCVVARAAPSDLTTPLSGGSGAAALLLGARIRSGAKPVTPEMRLAREASPISHITPDDPPFLLIHGDKDDVVPYELSERFERKLSSAGIEVKLIRVRGAGHGPALKGAIEPPDIGGWAGEWFDRYLRGQ
ncbi:MAG: alpha/beta hydrolase [bacterium]|nr:alpha/beta hydrolase [bacterium]